LLQVGDSLPYQGAGGFNEQALCNAVFAFDKAGLLRRDLLQAIFAVTALRLHRSSVEDTMSFKPQVGGSVPACAWDKPCCFGTMLRIP
jgi:hypothetical protein